MTHNRWLAAALGVVCVASLIAYRFGLFNRTPTTQAGDQWRPDLSELVRALGAFRPLEARLTGGFAYGAIPAASRSARSAQELGPDVRIAIARIEKNAARSNAEADWAALGTSYVVSGQLENAVQVLEAAVATPAPNPAWLSDLSAVYLAVAQRSDRPELVPKALAAAERATRLNGRLREAVFNRALALEAIHLTDQAEAGWKAYRDIDPNSQWSQEALAHLTKIEQERSAASTRWEKVARGIETETDGPAPQLDDVKAVRHLLRPWIETTLLPAWAERELEGDRVGAAGHLRRARSAATLLLKAGGDQMPREGISAIERALQRPDRRQALVLLARAHVSLRAAIHLTEEGHAIRADTEFRSAARQFAIGGSPYVHWAPIYRSVAQYAAGHFDDARQALELVRVARGDTRYGYLNGRRKWISGLILSNKGHLLASVTDYREANRALQSSGELDAELSVSALMAEVLGVLGSSAEAWRYQLNALNGAMRFGTLQKKHLLLLKLGSVLCLNSNLAEAALYFQTAVIDVSASNHEEQPSTLVDAYFIRARIDQKLGDAIAAREDLERARAQLLRIGDESLRRREEAEILLAEASILQNAAPSTAIVSATRAIELFRDSAIEARMVALHLTRGRAYLAAQQPKLAEADFSTAVRHFESQRELMSDRQYRASLFQEGWQVFAELARVQVVWRKNAAAGLDYAERGRARTLLEAATGVPGVQPLTVEAVQHRLPARTAALFFMTLDDRLLIWAVRSGSITLAERPLGATKLRARIDRMLWLLRQPGSDGARASTDLRALFLELVEPVRPFLAQVDTIAVVPDGPLHALPFAALIDPGTGRYLVQDFVVMTAPSLSTLVRRRGSQPHGERPNNRALVVGNPAHRRTPEEAWLPQLPFSQQESETVAAVYPNALLLSRDLATKRAVLDNLGRFDIVHYAGHAVVNNQTPPLSRLLLARDGASEEDGALFMSELSKVRLDNTKLVVLAACSTASGMVSDGEGIASIARPFLEAGAATVVATLWDVQDQSAASLFQQFHRHVASGQHPPAALALAQRQSIEHQDPTSRAPSQWAWAVSIGAVAQD